MLFFLSILCLLRLNFYNLRCYLCTQSSSLWCWCCAHQLICSKNWRRKCSPFRWRLCSLYCLSIFLSWHRFSLFFPLRPAIIVWHRPPTTTLLPRCDVSIKYCLNKCVRTKASVLERIGCMVPMQSLLMIKHLHSYLQRNIWCIRSDSVKLFIEL